MTTYDPSDPTDVEQKKQAVRRKKNDDKGRLKALLRDEKYGKFFRQWVWKHLEKCGLFSTTSAMDVHQMAIYSGQRDVGLWMLRDIVEADPSSWTLMQEESKEDA